MCPLTGACVRDLIAKGHQAKSHKLLGRTPESGMLLFQAESMEEPKKSVAQDPLIKNNCVSYEIYQWCVVEQ